MTIAVVAWGFFTLWAVGYLAVSAAGVRTRGEITGFLTELATGVSILGAFGTALILLGGRISVVAVYAVIGIVGAIAAMRGVQPLSMRWARPAGRGAVTLLAAAAVVWLGLAAGSLGDWLQWDAWAFWTLKARALFMDGRLPDTLMTLAGPYPWTHPEYPLGLPLFDWWLFAHAGAPRPELASFAGAVWLALLPIALWRSLRDTAGDGWAAGAAFGAMAFWPITFLAVGGHAEIILTLVVLAAVYELAAGLDRDGGHAVARFSLLLALATLSKNEGIALVTVAVAVGGAALWKARGGFWKPMLWLVLPFAAVGPWFLFTRSMGLGAEHIGDPPVFGEILSRVSFLVGTFLELVITRAWIPLPFLLIAGLLARRRRGGRDGRAAWLLVLGYFLVTQVVYLLTPLELEWLVINSYFRIVGVLVPAVVFLSIREIALLQPALRDPRDVGVTSASPRGAAEAAPAV